MSEHLLGKLEDVVELLSALTLTYRYSESVQVRLPLQSRYLGVAWGQNSVLNVMDGVSMTIA